MRVTIDTDRCRGHGVCCATCPEVFVMSDDGYAEVPVAQVPGGLEEQVRTAIAGCPERAITAK